MEEVVDSISASELLKELGLNIDLDENDADEDVDVSILDDMEPVDDMSETVNIEETDIGEQSETIELTETLPVESETSNKSNQERRIRLPLAKIKMIMKSDPDVSITSHESIVLIAMATVIFFY